MSPRPYRLGQRKIAADRTRARILAAARELLGGTGAMPFSLENVARQAGVARMTVYHQFGNRLGLLEALFDAFASEGLASDLRDAFECPEPEAAVDGFVRAYCGFWARDRRAVRRLRALAPVDEEVGRGVGARDERRRDAVRMLLRRVAIRRNQSWTPAWDDAADVVHALTNFETFDALAREPRTTARVTELIQSLVRAAITAVTGAA